ncbi:M24 family metallopeptidase [Streptomyces bugieae]|uniref:M24 family metallopeptidase n=1 Tax=Streptomyces bugieae TaxID=3098223 RepID=A0ABU7NH52_9ACTN|nr:M24 family metallopeptidase [Streptomyces sp. DSM 41528]
MPHLPPQPPQQPDPPRGLPEPGFPPEEYAQRLAGTREAMARDGLDLLLVTAPEDIHYHCGLNHQGHFAVTAGARENAVAAAVHDAMFRAGGDLPGFAPLVRSTDRLDQEHLTWTRREFGPRDGVFLELSAAYGRYHAPLARLHHLDPRDAARHRPAAEASQEAMRALCAALRPDRTAEQVFGAWRAVVEEAIGRPYRRHHCGYLVGIGFPPSWMGGTRTLRPGNPLRLRAGMTFHVQSWLLDERLGTYACSDTALVAEDGCEVLTRTPYPQ